MASELEVCFIETSAKAGINVKQLFNEMAMNLPGGKDTPGSPEKKDEGFNLGQQKDGGSGGAAKDAPEGSKGKGGCC